MTEQLRFLATYRIEDWRMRVRIHHPDGSYLGETHILHRDPTLVRGVAESYVSAYLNLGIDDIDHLSIGVHGSRITPPSRKPKRKVSKPRVAPAVAAAMRRGCPTPHKAAFPTRYDAERYLARSWGKLAPGGYAAVRVYTCPCGLRHLTSWSEDYKAAA